MATLDDLKKQEPLWFKVQNLFKKIIKKNASLLWGIIGILFIVLSIINCRPFSFSNSIQIVLTIIVIALSAFNIYLIRYYKKGTLNTPFSAPSKLIILSIIIVLCAIALFVWNLKHTSLESDHSSMWIWLISILSLSLLNFVFPRLYQHKWDMPEVLRPLIHIEGIAVIIAILQLFIAIPQLESSLKASTSEDINSLGEMLITLQQHLDDYNSVEIPDSLVNEEVVQARLFQKQLYSYSLYLYGATSSLEQAKLDQKFFVADSSLIKTLIDANIPIKLLNEDVLLLQNINALNYCQNINKILMANCQCLMAINSLQYQILEYYEKSADSVMVAHLLLGQTYININTLLTTYFNGLNSAGQDLYTPKMVKLVNDICSRYSNHMNKIDQLIMQIKLHRLNNIVNVAIQKNWNSYNISLYVEIMKRVDQICLSYSNMLNVIQLEHAYKVDF